AADRMQNAECRMMNAESKAANRASSSSILHSAFIILHSPGSPGPTGAGRRLGTPEGGRAPAVQVRILRLPFRSGEPCLALRRNQKGQHKCCPYRPRCGRVASRWPAKPETWV